MVAVYTLTAQKRWSAAISVGVNLSGLGSDFDRIIRSLSSTYCSNYPWNPEKQFIRREYVKMYS